MSSVAGSLSEWAGERGGENERMALFPVSWGRALRPDSLPLPWEHTCVNLTGNNLAATPNSWGRASAGTEQRLVNHGSAYTARGLSYLGAKTQ